MPRHILLVHSDPLTRLIVESGLASYGYEVVSTSTYRQAAEVLESRRVSVLVADLTDDTVGRLAFVKMARTADPSLAVIYTAPTPAKVPDRDKVAGAPCLRAPYHPHQLVSLIGHLFRRGADEEGAPHAA